MPISRAAASVSADCSLSSRKKSEIESAAGSRPSVRMRARTSSMLVRARFTSKVRGSQPSACAATFCLPNGVSRVPSRIGGCGFWTGFG